MTATPAVELIIPQWQRPLPAGPIDLNRITRLNLLVTIGSCYRCLHHLLIRINGFDSSGQSNGLDRWNHVTLSLAERWMAVGNKCFGGRAWNESSAVLGFTLLFRRLKQSKMPRLSVGSSPQVAFLVNLMTWLTGARPSGCQPQITTNGNEISRF